MVFGNVITRIEWHDTLGGSPASCRLEPDGTAILKLAKDNFPQHPRETKIFIILHELGHAVLQTGDEIRVDRWAFKEYRKMGLPLDKAVLALTRVLPHYETNPEQAERIRLQFNRAKGATYIKRGNWRKFKNLKP